MAISSEMIEAVGHEYMEEFFGCCESVLAEDGLLVLQVIAIWEETKEFVPYLHYQYLAIIIISTFILFLNSFSDAWGGSCFYSSYQYQKNAMMTTGKVQILSRNTSSLVDAYLHWLG